MYLRRGQPAQALRQYRESARIATELGVRLIETRAYTGLSSAYRQLGDLDQARAHGREALARARQGGYRVLEGQALTALAETELAGPDADGTGARDLAEEALAVHRETGHRLGLARTFVILGRAVLREGGPDAAARAADAWRSALDLFTRLGTPEADEVRVLLRLPPVRA